MAWKSHSSAVQELLLGPKIKDSATDTMVHSNRGIWFEINRDTPVPHGLRQLQRLLEQRIQSVTPLPSCR